MPPTREWERDGAKSRKHGLGIIKGQMMSAVLPDEILHPGPGRIRALICMGANPAVALPDQRKTLEALYADHRPVGAYDLADRISPPGGRRLAPISIYRALDFLVEQGFVHRLSSRNAFIACPHGHGADEAVAFLICEVCGGVDEDASPAMRSAIRGMAQARQFKTSYQVVEIVGRCEHCRNAEAA